MRTVFISKAEAKQILDNPIDGYKPLLNNF